MFEKCVAWQIFINWSRIGTITSVPEASLRSPSCTPQALRVVIILLPNNIVLPGFVLYVSRIMHHIVLRVWLLSLNVPLARLTQVIPCTWAPSVLTAVTYPIVWVHRTPPILGLGWFADLVYTVNTRYKHSSTCLWRTRWTVSAGHVSRGGLRGYGSEEPGKYRLSRYRRFPEAIVMAFTSTSSCCSTPSPARSVLCGLPLVILVVAEGSCVVVLLAFPGG